MSMSDLDIETTEQMYDDYSLDEELYRHQEHLKHLEAIGYIKEFSEVVKEEDEYADLAVAEGKIIEYQEVYVNYEQNSNDELKTKIESLGQIIVDISQKLKEQANQIPISEKKLITRKEFEELYGIQEETQRILRNRTNDPLPYTQLTPRGNIYYEPKKVDKWLENYKKER